nr:1-aminocyclopropane-1-carboxylate deaminase [Leptospira weilii]
MSFFPLNDFKAQLLSDLDRTLIQPIVSNFQTELSILRDDRLAFGMGTKFRKFSGIHSALEKKNVRSVILQGELHGNALAAFAFLFRNFGYHVHTICYTRDPNRSGANSIFVKRNSHFIQVYNSRSEWKNAVGRISSNAKSGGVSSQEFLNAESEIANEREVCAYIVPIDDLKNTNADVSLIPEYGLSRTALNGLDSLWKQIPTEKYDRLVLDIGSGLTWLSAKLFFQNRMDVVGVCVGLPKKKMIDWLKEKQNCLGFETFSIEDSAVFESEFVGGFGSTNLNILEYCNSFYLRHKIPIEPIYSGRTLYTIEQKMASGEWKGKTLYLHQGGLWNFLDSLPLSKNVS